MFGRNTVLEVHIREKLARPLIRSAHPCLLVARDTGIIFAPPCQQGIFSGLLETDDVATREHVCTKKAQIVFHTAGEHLVANFDVRSNPPAAAALRQRSGGC
jgi:hypothetical protein